MQYVLNVKKFKRLMELGGFSSLNDFVKVAGVHRNTLRSYLGGQASVFSTIYDKLCHTLQVDQLTLLESSAGSARHELARIIESAQEKYPDCAFILLGSRAKGSAKLYSDWDIGVTNGPIPLKTREYLALKQDVLDLGDDFINKIDIINLDAAPQWFLESIDYEPIFLGGSERAYFYFRGLLDGTQKNAA